MREQKFSCKFYQSLILLRIPQAKLPALPDSDWEGKGYEVTRDKNNSIFLFFGSYDKKASGTEAGTFRPDDFQIALVSEIIF